MSPLHLSLSAPRSFTRCRSNRSARWIAAAAALLTAAPALAQPTELLFSEYAHGTNQVLEIYNPTNSTIDIGPSAGNYIIQLYYNGNVGVGATFSLGFIGVPQNVTPGDVFVIARANIGLSQPADITTNGMNFTGNDAVVLRKGGSGGAIVDVIGQVGFNPGFEWGTGDTSTALNTLRRKPNICQGDTNGSNSFDPSIEWDGFPANTYDNIGSHFETCPRDCNSNGISDNCDLGCGMPGGPCDVPGCGGISDCNSNNIPDNCETGDCNTNNTNDICDGSDCNVNGTLDLCDATIGGSEDDNTNGVPDECEITVTWCLKGDMNHDRTITAADVPGFVTALLTNTFISADRCGADVNNDTDLDGLDVQAFLAVMTSPDTDFDGLPDIFESNNGAVLSSIATGTSPTNPDSDGDGLGDGDELLPTLAGLDLRALGASPVRKDLFIEVDWFDDTEGSSHSHRPTPAVVGAMVAAFAAAPTTNPYGGAPGIDIHIDYGQGGLFTGGNLIPGSDTIVLFDSEFNTYKAANFNNSRFGYFHYSIFCHRYNSSTNNSSGIAEILGDDFIVSLQTALSTSNVSKTMMHELGHNLGLLHGGFENRNYKPNYNSVMNYRFQFGGADTTCDAIGDGLLNYSIGARISLNENSLNENNGVCGAGNPVDWNFAGGIQANIAQNINCSAGAASACGVANSSCDDSTCNTLNDYNDWANLTLIGTAGDLLRGVREVIICQDTPPVEAAQSQPEP